MIVNPAQKIKFSIKDFFSKSKQICSKLQIWSHLQRKSLSKSSTFVQWKIYGYSPAFFQNHPLLKKFTDEETVGIINITGTYVECKFMNSSYLGLNTGSVVSFTNVSMYNFLSVSDIELNSLRTRLQLEI